MKAYLLATVSVMGLLFHWVAILVSQPGSVDTTQIDICAGTAVERELAGPSSGVATRDKGTIRGEVTSTLGALRLMAGRSSASRGGADDLLERLRLLLGDTDVSEVASSLSHDDLAAPMGTAVLECWLAADRATASRWIAALPGATDHHAWLVAQALTREPELLERFCQCLEEGPWAQSFLGHASRILLATNPRAAATLAECLAQGEGREELMEAIASDWVLRDPLAARAWIDSEPNTTLRQRLIVVGAQSQASLDALAALEWLLASGPSDTDVSESMHTIACIGLYSADLETADWFRRLLICTDIRGTFEGRPQ